MYIRSYYPTQRSRIVRSIFNITIALTRRWLSFCYGNLCSHTKKDFPAIWHLEHCSLMQEHCGLMHALRTGLGKAARVHIYTVAMGY